MNWSAIIHHILGTREHAAAMAAADHKLDVMDARLAQMTESERVLAAKLRLLRRTATTLNGADREPV